MSKNILVRDSNGALKELLNISHIITDAKFSNERYIWIPKDEVEAGGNVKMIYDDGTYRPIIMIPDADSTSY